MAQQKIEAGIIADLAKKLFGNFKGILDAAAEYEEEMGVLKQVSRIPIEKGGKMYTLTIKLSPVKNKKNLFYIEAETDAPGLDVSAIDKQAKKLDNSKIDEFNKLIDNLLTQKGYEPQHSDVDTDENIQQEQVEPENREDKTELGLQGDLVEKIDTINAELNKTDIIGKLKGSPVQIEIQLTLDDSGQAAELTLDAINEDGESVLDDGNPYDDVIDGLIKNGEVIPEETLRQAVGNRVNAILKEEGITDVYIPVLSSSQVRATLSIDKQSNEVVLTAIQASTDIKAAIDIIDELASNDEFTSILTEDERSFAITDFDGEYDIEPIPDEEIDTRDTYIDLFRRTNNVYGWLQTYEWAVGPQEWHGTICDVQYEVTQLRYKFANWVMRNCNVYPMAGYGECNQTSDLAEFKDACGKLDLAAIKSDAIKCVEGLLEVIDIYYVNLSHEEQSYIDTVVESIKSDLSYA